MTIADPIYPLADHIVPPRGEEILRPPTDTDQETPMTTPNPDKPLRPSGDIKRRMLAGEPLTGAQIAEEYGIHPSTLGNVVRELKTEFGSDAVRGDIIPGAGNPKRYQRVFPAGEYPDQSAWGKGANVQSLRRKAGPNAPRAPKATEPKPAAPAPRKRKGLPHPVPELGSSLAVNALTLTPDGEVGLSIENDEGMWLVEVMAYSRKEPSA